MAITMMSIVAEHANLRGHGEIFCLGENYRDYHHYDSDMLSSEIYRNLSSAIVYRSYSADATLILFNHLWWFFNFGDFNGKYLQITNQKNSGASVQVNNLSNYNFNDQATSLMLVAANKDDSIERRASFRDLYLETWNRFLDDVVLTITDPDMKRRGDPTFTWEMFPRNISYLSPNLRYLKIHQPIKVPLNYWPDYKASMTHHIYLYLDSQGRITPWVARWAYWVEGGIMASYIAGFLEVIARDHIPALIDQTLKILLRNQFGSSNGGVYYLPGRQFGVPDEVETGLTWDDVTIIATK